MNQPNQAVVNQAAKPQQWTVVRASVRGKAHIDNGTPNQDAEHVIASPDGRCVAAAVCDGAGTAPRAEDGARHFANRICRRLYDLGERVTRGQIRASNRNQLTDEVFGLVQAARTELDPDGSHLAEYHCTLVAILITPELRLFLKLGDSLLLKTRFANTTDGKVDFFVDLAMTQQERSDYANETHFVTQPEWRDHLVRDTIPLDAPDMMYALMTDGAGDIALQGQGGTGQKRVYRGFFGNLVANLLALPGDERDAALHAALEHSGTHRLTGDDKTVVLLLRSDAFAHVGREPLLEEPAAVSTAAAAVASSTATPPPSLLDATAAARAVPPAGSPVPPDLSVNSTAQVATTGRPHASSGKASPTPPSMLPGGHAATGKPPTRLWVKGATIAAGILVVAMSGTLVVKALDKFGASRTQSSKTEHASDPQRATQTPHVVVPGNAGGAAPLPTAAAGASATPQGHVQPLTPTADVAAPPQGDAGAKAMADTARVIVSVSQGTTVVHTVGFDVSATKDGSSNGRKRDDFDVPDLGSIATTCTPGKASNGATTDVVCKFSIHAAATARLGKHEIALSEVSPMGALHGNAKLAVDVKKSTPKPITTKPVKQGSGRDTQGTNAKTPDE